MRTIFLFLANACRLLEFALVAYCVLTWFMPRSSRLLQTLGRFFEPFLRPIQGLLARLTGGLPLDFSPIVLALIIQLVQSLFLRIAYVF